MVGDCMSFGISDLDNTDERSEKYAIMNIKFPKPTECTRCGFHNFRIVGVVYNGDLNYIDVKVKCMRCGEVRTHLNTNKI